MSLPTTPTKLCHCILNGSLYLFWKFCLMWRSAGSRRTAFCFLCLTFSIDANIYVQEEKSAAIEGSVKFSCFSRYCSSHFFQNDIYLYWDTTLSLFCPDDFKVTACVFSRPVLATYPARWKFAFKFWTVFELVQRSRIVLYDPRLKSPPGARYFNCPKRPNRFWGPQSSLFNVYQDSYRGQMAGVWCWAFTYI